MIWLWLCAAAALLLLLLLASEMHGSIYLSRVTDNDHLYIDVRALYGLVRRRVEIPVIKFRGMLGGLVLRTQQLAGMKAELQNDEHNHITPDEIIRFYQNSRRLLDKTDDLLGWMKETLSHVKCTELRWETRIGIGDAAETALTTGIVWGLKSSILGYMNRLIHMETLPRFIVQPQYNRTQFTTEMTIKGSVRLGYIVWAGLLLLLRIVKVKGGIRAWQSILFKAT